MSEAKPLTETCKACGSDDCSWSFAVVNTANTVDGRLRIHDMKVIAVCDCNLCSETVCVSDAQKLLDARDATIREQAEAVRVLAAEVARFRDDKRERGMSIETMAVNANRIASAACEEAGGEGKR